VVAKVNAEVDAIGTSTLRNMSRRPAVNIAASAPAVEGHTANISTISIEAELPTHVDIPNTTPIDARPRRSSHTTQRGVVRSLSRATGVVAGSARARVEVRRNDATPAIIKMVEATAAPTHACRRKWSTSSRVNAL